MVTTNISGEFEGNIAEKSHLQGLLSVDLGIKEGIYNAICVTIN